MSTVGHDAVQRMGIWEYITFSGLTWVTREDLEVYLLIDKKYSITVEVWLQKIYLHALKTVQT